MRRALLAGLLFAATAIRVAALRRGRRPRTASVSTRGFRWSRNSAGRTAGPQSPRRRTSRTTRAGAPHTRVQTSRPSDRPGKCGPRDGRGQRSNARDPGPDHPRAAPRRRWPPEPDAGCDRYSGRLNSSATEEGDDWEFARIGDVLTAYRWIPWLSRPTRFNRPNVGDPWVTAQADEVRVEITGTATSRSQAADGEFPGRAGPDVRGERRPRLQPDRESVIRGPYGNRRGRRHHVLRLGLPAGAILDVASRALREFERNIGPYPHRS